VSFGELHLQIGDEFLVEFDLLLKLAELSLEIELHRLFERALVHLSLFHRSGLHSILCTQDEEGCVISHQQTNNKTENIVDLPLVVLPSTFAMRSFFCALSFRMNATSSSRVALSKDLGSVEW